MLYLSIFLFNIIELILHLYTVNILILPFSLSNMKLSSKVW